MAQVHIIGIDLAKQGFQLHGARADGSVAFRKKLTRPKVLDFMASQPRCLVAMEACAGAHYWSREICELGHEVKIIPNAFGEKAVLKLMFAAMLRASERWRALRVTGFERRQMDALRKELDQNYKEDNDIRQPSADMRQKKLPSIYRI